MQLLALLALALARRAAAPIVGAALLGTHQIERGTEVAGREVGGLSGLASDGARLFAASDRGSIFVGSASLPASPDDGAPALRVDLLEAYQVGRAGGNPARPLYVDAEGIATCGGPADPALLVSTEDPPRIFRLNKTDGTAWGLPTPLPVNPQLRQIVNTSSVRPAPGRPHARADAGPKMRTRVSPIPMHARRRNTTDSWSR